jgi:hypothetical protein
MYKVTWFQRDPGGSTTYARPQTIQEANVARLREIEPKRVFVAEADLDSTRFCGTDFLHGKAVAWLLPDGSQEVDVLCMPCAVRVTELWLEDPGHQVTIAVAR